MGTVTLLFTTPGTTVQLGDDKLALLSSAYFYIDARIAAIRRRCGVE